MAIETKNQVASFPADWDEPFEDGETFYFDPMHFPHPVSPLTASTMGPAFEVGITTAAREQEAPLKDYQVRYRNHYRFDRQVIAQPASESEARSMGEAAEASAKTEVGRLLERWHGEHLPRVSTNLDRLRAMDVPGATDAELVTMLDEVDAIHRDLWTVHFRIALPMLVGIQLYDEFYAELFGEAEADSHALLVGGVSESVKAGFGLSDLAASARELGLAQLIQETPSYALLPALEATKEGRAFLAKLQAYLDEYGLRQDLFEYTTPTWLEDPSIALSSIRNYVLTERDARAEHAAMARSAESALAAAREQLVMYPEAVRSQFEALVQFGRQGTFLQEEHNFYIDQRGLALLRLFYLRVGDRLVDQGRLGASDDIFMLTSDELRNVVAGAGNADAANQVRALIQTRREEIDLARTLTPPPFLGAAPTEPPPTGNPMERANARFFGGPPQQSDTPGQLNGNAGSRGVATGIARVARTLEEATRVLPGEILVAVTTMPAWTPLFGIVAAVVTETGGPLSHCAIVAREYGIPAVVGAYGATGAIATGQRITVDGGSGIVTLDA
jgi:rifampicin phosphotransferase